MSMVIKFACDGDFSRVRIGSLTWEEVVRAASASFPELHQGSFDLKYHDDEDDLCLLSATTFPDFASLNEEARTLHVELVKKTEAVPSGPSQPKPCLTDAGLNATVGSSELSAGSQGCAPRVRDPFGGVHPCDPLRGFVQDVPGGLHRASTLTGGDAMAVLFVHFLPQLLHRVRSAHARIDRIAAEKPEYMRLLIQALREALEPFPQCQESQIVLDRILHARRLEGMGSATEAFLQALIPLPFEQQLDIASFAIGRILEKLLQTVPDQAAQAAETWIHLDVTCDGCGAMPILGPHFKCTECPDYDLCRACYMHRDVLHSGHKFYCGPHSRGKGKGRGCGPCPFSGSWGNPHFRALANCWGKECGKGWGAWSKGWGKDWGKGCGKGWGKAWGKGWDSDAGGSSSDSSSSDAWTSSGRSKSNDSATNWKLIRHELRAAKLAWKNAKTEAKCRCKAAKKERKQERRARRECAKLEHTALKPELSTPAAEQPKAQGDSLTFPMDMAKGRRLATTCSRDGSPEHVAVHFTEKHGLADGKLPKIPNVVHHAETEAGEGSPPASEPAQQAVEPVPITLPTESALEEEDLRSLEAMGFTNRELNSQLIAENNGNLEAVVDMLLL